MTGNTAPGTAGAQRTQVFITVMTYPHPSEKYTELVCTAGITADHQWIRLYPVDYRYRTGVQRYRKYQWVEVDLMPRESGNDRRPESRKPILESLRIMGEPVGPQRNWAQRRAIVDAMPHRTLNQWKALYDVDRTSLGIVRPTRVLDVEVRPSTDEWKPEWQAIFKQGVLFGDAPKELKKLPFSWHYVFECEDSAGKPHTAMNEDWEIGVLFWKELERLGNQKAAAESVRKKCLQMVATKHDTRFFMGTRFPYNTWLVLGVFWPPKETPGLFSALS
jgi:hypothetical protein